LRQDDVSSGPEISSITASSATGEPGWKELCRHNLLAYLDVADGHRSITRGIDKRHR